MCQPKNKTNIMKKFSLNLFWCLCATVLTIAFTACESKDDEESGSKRDVLSNYLRVRNVSAHYVGNAVVVDFQLENISKTDLRNFTLKSDEISFDNGGRGGYVNLSTGEGQPYFLYELDNLTLAKGEIADIRMKIDGDAVTSGVRKANITLRGGTSGNIYNLDDNRLIFSCSVEDHRTFTNSVWTNDDRMEYSTPTIRRTGDDLYATFSVTNYTGISLGTTTISVRSVDNGNGQSNYYSYLIVNGQKSPWETQMTISRGEGRSVTLYVPDFYVSRPRCLNATLSISSKYYQFATDYVYLTSINV